MYEKKKTIRIGDMVNKYYDNIFWFITLSFNIIFTLCLEYDFEQLKKTTNNYIDENYYELIEEKVSKSKIICGFGLLLNLLSTKYQDNIKILYKNLFFELDELAVFIEFLPIALYISSSLLSNSVCLMILTNQSPQQLNSRLRTNNLKYDLEQNLVSNVGTSATMSIDKEIMFLSENYPFIFCSQIIYIIFEVSSLSIIFFTTFYFVKVIINNFTRYYKKNIENVVIGYKHESPENFDKIA
jgi:hypothetical protein